MSQIIRGEIVHERATFTCSKQIYFAEKNHNPYSFVEEECRKAFQKGEEVGQQMGFEKGVQEIKTFVNLAQVITQKLLEHKMRLIELMKPEVIEFVIALCERVIRKELSQKESMVSLINSLLNIYAADMNREPIRIFLAPDDLVMLEGALDRIQCTAAPIDNFSIHADPLIRRGDCRIDSSVKLINYTISRYLAELQGKILQ